MKVSPYAAGIGITVLAAAPELIWRDAAAMDHSVVRFRDCPLTRQGLRELMATHDVTVDLPTRFVLRSDVTFVVWSHDLKLGELQVSKGSIDWLPGNGRTRYRRAA